MSQTDKICMELAFNKKISYSQRIKVKEFWSFLDTETPLKPYSISSGKSRLQQQNSDEQTSMIPETMWRDQFKVFQEHGLDKTALAATETCKLCSIRITDSSELADMVKEPYEELLEDIKNFDEKLNDKTKNSPLERHNLKYKMSHTPHICDIDGSRTCC